MMKQIDLYQERYQRIILAAICIALASQVIFKPTLGFIITLSVFICRSSCTSAPESHSTAGGGHDCVTISEACCYHWPRRRSDDNVIYILADMALHVLAFSGHLYWRKTERPTPPFSSPSCCATTFPTS